MKKIIITGLIAVFGLASCNKWLELSPETQPTEEQIMSTADGYRAALNGLYRSMGSATLYGKDMTFGVVDAISQQYDLSRGDRVTNQVKYIAAGRFEYDHPNLNPTIEGIWQNGYNVIANANNLMQKIEEVSPEFFNQGEMEKNLIYGEAMAVRALMHFDLLRLYAPAPVNDDGAAYLPYVDRYPNTVPSPITIEPFLDKVVEDLERARDYVAEWDTSEVGSGTLITGNARFYNTFNFGTVIYSNSTRYEDFFKGRGYRMNYFAITAILARVHNYRGEYEQAAAYAKEVMDFTVRDNAGVQQAFARDLYTGAQSSNWDTKNDLKTVSNLIFAIHNARAYQELSLEIHFKREFYSGSIPTWFVINQDAQRIFENHEGLDESGIDRRSLYLIYYANGIHPISGKYFLSTTEATRDRNAMVIPVIRSSELRYIIAEAHARKGDFVNASQVMRDLRANRGLAATREVTSWSEFQEELIRDARREYISEGQLFYLYKRLNAPVNFGQGVVRPLTRSEYLLPIPTIQI